MLASLHDEESPLAWCMILNTIFLHWPTTQCVRVYVCALVYVCMCAPSHLPTDSRWHCTPLLVNSVCPSLSGHTSATCCSTDGQSSAPEQAQVLPNIIFLQWFTTQYIYIYVHAHAHICTPTQLHTYIIPNYVCVSVCMQAHLHTQMELILMSA